MKLTKRDIDAARYHGKIGTAHFLWDDAVPGLAVRLYPSGRKAFFLAYRANGRQRSITLGSFGELTLQEARTLALEMRGHIRRGADPIGERRARLDSPSVADLADRYMREHARAKKKPSSAEGDERNWKLHILPRIGRRKVADLTRADVAGLHAELAGTPYVANRVLALLSKAFHLAEVWGWRPDGSNPCRHVSRYRETQRERFLSEAELAQLARVLPEVERERSESPFVIAAIRLLILTGCRVGGVLQLRWDEVDFEGKRLRLRDSKTGRKTIYLGSAALQLLSRIERDDDNPYVIRGAKPGQHLFSLTRPWFRIRERAGLRGVRLHDLRHSYASVGAGAGLSLPMIGKLLGHRHSVTTERYAHLAADPAHQAAELIDTRIAAAMRDSPAADSADGRELLIPFFSATAG